MIIRTFRHHVLHFERFGVIFNTIVEKNKKHRNLDKLEGTISEDQWRRIRIAYVTEEDASKTFDVLIYKPKSTYVLATVREV